MAKHKRILKIESLALHFNFKQDITPHVTALCHAFESIMSMTTTSIAFTRQLFLALRRYSIIL